MGHCILKLMIRCMLRLLYDPGRWANYIRAISFPLLPLHNMLEDDIVSYYLAMYWCAEQ
jgi:hypothetical protein